MLRFIMFLSVASGLIAQQQDSSYNSKIYHADFRLENWAKSIKALATSGIAIDPDNVPEFEAGRRFFIKVNDKDLAEMHKFDRTRKVHNDNEIS
ncbi:MAG: hypothetical protein HRT89_15850 [Lentisphaeria bacterium]|nr:hypothetical protein [Lentisphaeria bacterium]NQZ69532.1 hypothetical protein [Lentisphaeria bacterium]